MSTTRTTPPAPAEPNPADTTRHAAVVLAAAFGADAYDADLTRTALTALGTIVWYLRDCLGPAQPAAIPDLDVLNDTVVALAAASGQLRTGLLGTLTAIDGRRLPRDLTGIDIRDVAAMRAALACGCDALGRAAVAFAAAHTATNH